MINDLALKVATEQAVTVTAVSASSVDLSSAASAGHQSAVVGANPHSIGTGYRLFLVIDVTTTATAGGAAVVTFEVITATDELLTANIETLGISDGYAVATLTAAREPIAVAINPDIGNQQGQDQRFLGMRFNVTTGPLLTGNFTAGFQLDYQDARLFPARSEVSSPAFTRRARASTPSSSSVSKSEIATKSRWVLIGPLFLASLRAPAADATQLRGALPSSATR